MQEESGYRNTGPARIARSQDTKTTDNMLRSPQEAKISEMERMFVVIEANRDLLERLESRLKPVLSLQPESVDKARESYPHISDAIDEVGNSNKKIMDIIDRLVI